MNYMDRLSRVSSHVMTLTGFFHGIIRLEGPFQSPEPSEARTNVVRYHILKCLERPGTHHLTEISATLNIKKNTTSELLDRMVRDKLLSRRYSSDDRRKVLLTITPKGRAAIKEFEKLLMTYTGNFLETLSGPDRRDLVLAIESMVRILERHDRRAGKTFPF
jgi:DNA-binding MarR family transcriptional regulator